MRIHALAVCILTTTWGNGFGQSKHTTVYPKLETKVFYVVNVSAQTVNGNGVYQVNGKEVAKSVYDKYYASWQNIESCCPCILERYDESDMLISEYVSCGDCGVGDFKQFYPNGKVKLVGRYKENPSGNWDDLWERRYCSIPDGKWTYFSEQGDTLYSEFWEDGKFVSQVPEQKAVEIWDVELTLHGERIENQSLTIQQIQELVVIPRFKNSSRENMQLTVNLKVSAIGHRTITRSSAWDALKTIDVRKMLSDSGIRPDTQANFDLEVCNNEQVIKSFQLKVQR
jgi:hypothetical protein